MKRYGILAFCLAAACSLSASAEEGKTFVIAEKYQLVAPANWVVKQPAVNFIEYEFQVPAVEGDANPGRVTVMGAGGGIDMNVDRWKKQFKSDDGEVKAEVKQLEAAGTPVHLVDIKGTYLDKPAGPFAGGKETERPDYRMISAIISTKEGGQYYIKMYGPAKTMAATEAPFKKMIEGLEAK